MVARHRDPRRAPHDALGPSRAAMRRVRRERWTLRALRRGRRRRSSASTSLHGLPEPQGDRAAAAPGRAVRPPARRPRPQPVLRPRPRGAAALAARHRHHGARPVDASTSPSSSSCRSRWARARVRARPRRRACSTRRRCRSTGCSAPRATSCCRRSGPSTPYPADVRGASPTPRSRTCSRCCSTSASRFLARPGDRHAAGDRGVRLAARLDELHRGARRAPARPGAADEDRAVGLARGSPCSTPSTWAGTTCSTTSAGSPSRPRARARPRADRPDQPRPGLSRGRELMYGVR